MLFNPGFLYRKKDVDGLTGEPRIFHSHFKDCSDRKEPAENFFRYMSGQFGDSERKSAEPIAIHAEGGSVRSVQRTLTDAVRKEDKIKDIYRRLIVQDMGDPNGILITGESGFQKKGNDSVGVAGQYCGCLGKVGNSQVGVFSAYASPRGYVLSDKRLFVPEKRFGSDHAAERKKCGVPEESEFRTEPQPAAGMIEELRKENVLPFKYIVADCLYGNSPEFIESPDCYADRIFSVSIQSDTRCRLRTSVIGTEEYRYDSETGTRKSVSEEPVSVSEWAAELNGHFRYKRKVSEGTEGPIEYEFTKREVTVAENGLQWKRVWLIIERTVGKERTYSYYTTPNLVFGGTKIAFGT